MAEEKVIDLTEEQKAKIPGYIEKWTNIGLAMFPMDTEKISGILDEVYNEGSKAPPIWKVFTQSPVGCIFGKVIVENLAKDELVVINEETLAQIVKNMNKKSKPTTYKNIQIPIVEITKFFVEKLKREAKSYIDGKPTKYAPDVYNYVYNFLCNIPQPEGAFYNALWEYLYKCIKAEIPKTIKNFHLYDFIYGQHDAGWLAMYEFFLNELKLDVCKKLVPLMKLAECSHWCLPYEEICFISATPVKLNLQDGRLHKDGDVAIEYSDGLKIWALNGCVVTQEIAETPANELNCQLLLTEQNAQVRHEIVKKIGYTRIMQELEVEIVDKINALALYMEFPIGDYHQQGDILIVGNPIEYLKFDELAPDFKERLKTINYELVLLKSKDGNKRPFLKMDNASNGEPHYEGVLPDCKTVFDAIKFRNKTDCLPFQLT